MFGEDISGKLLERWPTTFKTKIIQQCRKLPSISELEEHLLAADPPEDGTELDVDFGKLFVVLLNSDLKCINKLHISIICKAGYSFFNIADMLKCVNNKLVLLQVGTGTCLRFCCCCT